MDEQIWDSGFPHDFNPAEGYGRPISPREAATLFGKERAAEPTIAIVVREGEVKARRGVPKATAEDFFDSLVSTADGRWFFSGVLNGWGGLDLLEIDSLQEMKGGKPGRIFWKSQSQGKTIGNTLKRNSSMLMSMFKRGSRGKLVKPYLPDKVEAIQVTLYLPKWKDQGYSKESPGFCWYYNAYEPLNLQKFSHGTNILSATAEHDEEKHGELPRATIMHHFGHRYAKVEESEQDKVIYHTGVLVEWDHEEYGTIIELGWRHGIGGYRGKSNWTEDKDGKPCSNLCQLLPKECILPFDENFCEIRFIDVPFRNADELSAFFKRYEGPTGRFIDPGIKESAKILVKNRTKPDLCRYVLNRLSLDHSYVLPDFAKKKAGFHCQSFSASFFQFLSKKHTDFYTMGGSDGILERIQWYGTSFADGKPMPIEYDDE